MPVKTRLKVRLAEMNMKQKDLAEDLGVSKQALNSWVSGKSSPSLETAFKIAKKLDTTIHDLWEWEE